MPSSTRMLSSNHKANMVVPKTPKSATTSVKTPKTPKSSGRSSAKDISGHKRADASAAKEKKRKRDATEAEIKAKKNRKESTSSNQEKASKPKASSEKKSKPPPTNKTAKEPKAPKAPKVREPVAPRTSIVDDVMEAKGSAGFFGQETKAKKMNTLQLKMAENYAHNGVFHYQAQREEDLEPLTEMHLAYLEDSNPIKKMKFAKSATKYCQLENEAFYAAKCRQLRVLQQLSGKQTLGMATIHADRTYLSGLDFDMSKLAKVAPNEVRQHLIEDYMVVAANADDATHMKPLAYKECNNIDKQWPATMTDAPNVTLAQLGQQMYGSTEAWPTL